MTPKESVNYFSAVSEVAHAFSNAKDINVEIIVSGSEYGHYVYIHLDNYKFRSANVLTYLEHSSMIKDVMKSVMTKLGTPKLLREENGFALQFKGVLFHITGYPSEYRMECEKVCYIKKGEEKIPVKLGEEITI